MSRLDSKVAIVTGGASGIGAATSRLFAREGARVAIWDIDDPGAAAVASEIGPNAIAVHCDVSKEAEVRAAVGRTLEAFGTVDILVNNGGAPPRYLPIEEVDEAEWDRTLDSHLKGCFFCCKHVAPILKQKRGGAIANACSTAGLRGSRHIQAYNAAKHGIAGLTKALAIEFGPDGVRVNAVAPGAVDTPMLRAGGTTLRPEVREQANKVPIGFVAQPEDIAAAYLFLVSDEARFVTGTVMSVDGGGTA
jgi:NAD(P)-dependent dehydrogenase (short-subunit alcohol dehydrogenase family)